MRRRRLPVIALVTWTLLVWLSRVRNVLADEDLDGTGVAWRIGAVVVFCGLAALVIVALTVRPDWLRGSVTALAAWTTGFWLIRGTGIALDDHETGFVVVHTVLMVVSIGLAAWAFASVRRPVPDGSPEPVAH